MSGIQKCNEAAVKLLSGNSHLDSTESQMIELTHTVAGRPLPSYTRPSIGCLSVLTAWQAEFFFSFIEVSLI